MPAQFPTPAEPAPAAVRSPRRRGALAALAVTGVLVAAGSGTAYAVTGTSTPAAPAAAAGSSSAAPAAPAAGPGSPPAPVAGTAGPGKPRPHIDGTVSKIFGDRLTVTDPDGFSREIQLSDGTTYRSGPTPPGSGTSSDTSSDTVTRSSIVVGTAVHAEGSVDADRTTLDATVVETRPAPPVAARPATPAAPPAAPGTAADPSSAATPGASRSPVNGS